MAGSSILRQRDTPLHTAPNKEGRENTWHEHQRDTTIFVLFYAFVSMIWL